MGCLSLAVELTSGAAGVSPSKGELLQFVTDKLNYLVSARPTAVNMQLSAEACIRLAQSLHGDSQVKKNLVLCGGNSSNQVRLRIFLGFSIHSLFYTSREKSDSGQSNEFFFKTR